MDFVYRPLGLQSEYGCSSSLNFLTEKNVTAYDSEGNEIVCPKCDKCDTTKSLIMGKEKSMWTCLSCGTYG